MSSPAIKEIRSIIKILNDEQIRRRDAIKNFEGFVRPNDPEGLQTLGRAIQILKIEWELTRMFIANIENALKLEVKK